MGKIYKGQTDLTIEVTVNFDLTDFTSALLIFKSSKGIEKIANDTVVIDPIKGVLKFTPLDDTFFNVSGEWKCWAKCVNADGLISFGEPSNFFLYEQGN
jgi:hypothetical protein